MTNCHIEHHVLIVLVPPFSRSIGDKLGTPVARVGIDIANSHLVSLFVYQRLLSNQLDKTETTGKRTRIYWNNSTTYWTIVYEDAGRTTKPTIITMLNDINSIIDIVPIGE